MHLSNIETVAVEEISSAVVEHLRNIGIKYRIKKHALPVIKLAQQTPKQTVLFRRPLQEIDSVDTLLVSGEIVKVPSFIVDACTSMRQNLGTEGIFRKAGSTARQKQIKEHIDAGHRLGMGSHEIDVANILKLFLRELPEPLLPSSYQEVLLRCLLLKDKKVEGLLLTCLLLPPSHLNTLAYLMGFFSEVASQSELNKMGNSNIAIIIAPSIMPLGKEKMTAASGMRLNRHVEVIELLIQHADKIGILPDCLCKIVNSSNAGSLSKSNSGNLHKSESDLLQSSKRKKSRRSGSLTRMFNGFRKMVGNKAESDTLRDENDRSECTPEPPNIKPGTKRKALVASSAFSMKKKRDVLKALPQMQTLASTPAASSWPTENPDLHTLTPRVCQHPNPRIRTPPPTRSKSKRFFTKSDKGDREQEVEKRSRLSLRGRKGAKKQDNKDEFPCSEMSNASNHSENLPLERRWSSSIFGRKKRLVDVQMLEPGMELVEMKRANNTKPESSCHAFSQSNNNMSLDGVNLSQQNMSNDSEDFVRIPKKEYEAIKNRVSAIEDKIEAFSNISMTSNNVSNNDVDMQAEKVQTAYEKTLEESTTFDNTSSSTDNLAKRLGRDLKIRQSLGNKVIRSPSARRIGTLRRRSRESARSFRNNSPGLRNTALVRNMSERVMSTPDAHFYPRCGLKRGGPNTVRSGLTQPNVSLPTTPKENARIQLCFHNDHVDGIDKKGEGLLVSKSPSFYSRTGSPLTRSMVQRSMSFQETGPSSGSKIPVPVNYFQASNASPGNFSSPVNYGPNKWQDAPGFFKENPTGTQTSVTARASVAKILELNAGIVSQRMKIFNSNISRGEPIVSHRRSFDKPMVSESPGPQFKRVMSAVHMGTPNDHPVGFTNTKANFQKCNAKQSFQEIDSSTQTSVVSMLGKSASPKKIGSPRKLAKSKFLVQRNKSNATNSPSSKCGATEKKNQKCYRLSPNLATSSKLVKNSAPTSPVAATLLQNSKENASAACSPAQKSPFINPQSSIFFSPQLSLPDNLKETIYSVCTPEVNKVMRRETSISPLKECNRTCTKSKTPRDTPFIKQQLLTITPHHFGKTPQKLTIDRSARKMLTPMRAITPLALPRRQSPRLLSKALVRTP